MVAPGAEVRTQEKTQMKFEETLGRIMGLFGGKAAKEGIVSTVAVKGHRKMRVAESRGEIIDPAEEKFYDVDFKNKSYKVRTFAEIRPSPRARNSRPTTSGKWRSRSAPGKPGSARPSTASTAAR
jgi:hypothetical protein